MKIGKFIRFCVYHDLLVLAVGGLMMLVGLILTPVIIGLPILITGWYIVSVGYWLRWIQLIPEKWQQQIGKELFKEYQPYKPAMKSMKKFMWQWLKISTLVFGVLGVTFILVMVKVNKW